MTDEQKTTREEPQVPFKGEAFATMMEKMMSRCVKMMPQMMAMCGGAQDDKEETATDATRPCECATEPPGS
ncbi:MAG: hypothetical protein GWN20_22365 [Phycisphaerae bacterium]|nr:hypothetical protein [Phycisphaerae bacterium]